ncbi:hypothetical protein GCM10023149_09580 [Mucilaginibacter gynuensis]|uniref:histidine kinase n=1 Tax=Mucilaginibacter gynuensis TaxID=1302236 RepID=A0ABP8FZ63_9SPHI
MTPYHILKLLLPRLLFTGLLSITFSFVSAQTSGDKLLFDKYKKIKDLDSSEVYAGQLLASAKKNNDKLFEARVLYTRSLKHYTKGNELEALDYATQAHNLTGESDSVTYAKTATMMAYMMSRQGNNVNALKVAFKMLRVTDAKGWKKLSADSRLCIADIYRTMNQAKEAIPYAEQAASDLLAARDTGMYIFALSTLSNIYSQREIQTPANIKTATRYMEIILNEPYVGKVSPFSKARYLSNLGRLYRMQNQNGKAEQVLLQSLDISRKEKFVAIEKHALNELATVKIDQKKYAEAVKYGQQALNTLANEQSPLKYQIDIYNRLTDAYEGLEDYKQAYLHLKHNRRLEDSLSNTEKNEAATKLSEQFKLDKRLLEASNKAKLLKQQRNFIIVMVIISAAALFALYRWVIYKRKKEADILAEEHRQLAKLDAMKTRFFANISHELRTPLTLIMGPLEQLVNQPYINDEQKTNHINSVLRNSKKLLNMLNELLDLGKIEAGSLPVHLQPVNLATFMRVLYQNFASAAEFRHIRYSLISDINEDIVADIDRDKFEKIANNLISNAIKYTPSNGNIFINAGIKDNQIAFSVADNGSGIHPDDMPHIFDRYFQGNREGAPAEGGTGIGLAIAREFTELLKGKITVENNYGKGSLFKVFLPLNISESTDTTQPAELDETATETLIAASNATQLIMVVEDHREMAGYISAILSPQYKVVTAYNGIEALTLLQTYGELPSLIISDVMMPDMDGFTLLNNLKQHTIYCSIPVIMLTALADDHTKLQALTIGVDDYLTKPFISSELLARAGNLITNAAARSHHHSDSAAEHEPTIAIPEVSPADFAWLAQIEELVRKYTGKTELNITMLSYDMAISERQLNRRIKQITGLTPNKYIRAIRLQIAREAIESGKYRTVAEISHAAGFDTPAYFSKIFKEHYGRDVNELL